jgi:hypothetical protein
MIALVGFIPKVMGSPWQGANHLADQHADEGEHQVLRGERDAEAQRQVLEDVFHRSEP